MLFRSHRRTISFWGPGAADGDACEVVNFCLDKIASMMFMMVPFNVFYDLSNLLIANIFRVLLEVI